MQSALLLTLSALLLSGCSSGKCEPKGLEEQLLRQMGFLEVDEVHGLRTLGDYQIKIKDSDLLDTNTGRYVCKATLQISGTTGETWKGIRRAMKLDATHGIDRIFERLRMQSIGNANVAEGDRQIKDMADFTLKVTGDVTYSVDKESGQLIAYEQDKTSLIENWLTRADAFYKGVEMQKLVEKKAHEDKAARDSGYKSSDQMQQAKKQEAAEMTLSDVSSKLAAAEDRLKTAIKRKNDLIARLKEGSFGDGQGLVSFENIKIRFQRNQFYHADLEAWLSVGVKNLSPDPVTIVGYDGLLYSTSTSMILLIKDGAISPSSRGPVQDLLAGANSSHLECCGNNQKLFNTGGEWKVFLHMKSAFFKEGLDKRFTPIVHPNKEIQRLESEVAPLREKAQMLKRSIDEMKRTNESASMHQPIGKA